MLAPNPAYFTANDLRNWAMTQEGEYNFKDAYSCAGAKFLQSRGYPNAIYGFTKYCVDLGKGVLTADKAIGQALHSLPWTYAALAERLAEIA